MGVEGSLGRVPALRHRSTGGGGGFLVFRLYETAMGTTRRDPSMVTPPPR